MLPRWLSTIWMRRDIRRIIDSMGSEQCELLRGTPESDLIRFHRSLGTGLRNGFRNGRFLGLSAHCHAVVRRNGEQMSFDALSGVAIHEVWSALRSRN